jgi:cytochrome b pre-mRNA-processing protein 3
MLHMYMLTVRFRNFPHDQSSIWHQHLLDHFFYDAENRMIVHHNMHARGTRNKYLKDLFVQFRGLLAAYDEGLVKGDPVLASAVWRNVFKGNENVDIEKLAAIVSYMRRVLDGVSRMDDQVFQMSIVEFPDPREEMKQVQLRSRGMDIAAKDETAQQPGM